MPVDQFPFDEEALKRFSDFELTPDEDAWDKLAPHISQKQKRRRGFMWWTSIGFLSVLLIGIGVKYGPLVNHERELPSTAEAIGKVKAEQFCSPSGVEVSCSKNEIVDLSLCDRNESKIEPVIGLSRGSLNRNGKINLRSSRQPEGRFVVNVDASSVDINVGYTEAKNALDSFKYLNPMSEGLVKKKNTPSIDSVFSGNDILAAIDNVPLRFISVYPKLELELAEDKGDDRMWYSSIRISTGITHFAQSYSSTSSLDLDYQNTRDSISTLQLSPSASIRYEVGNQSGLIAYVGAQYALQMSENYVLGIPRDSIFIEPTLDVLNQSVTGYNTFRTTEVDVLRVFNRYHTVALQVGVGYKYKINRFQPYALLDGGYEVVLHSRGVLPNQVGENVSIGGNSQWIEKRPGWQFGGTLGLDYNLNSKWGLGVYSTWLRKGSLSGSLDPLTVTRTSLNSGLSVSLKW